MSDRNPLITFAWVDPLIVSQGKVVEVQLLVGGTVIAKQAYPVQDGYGWAVTGLSIEGRPIE
jgi:hypothetical protein